MFEPGGGGYGCLLSQRICTVNSELTGAPRGPLCRRQIKVKQLIGLMGRSQKAAVYYRKL